jgi:hypothetical protein
LSNFLIVFMYGIGVPQMAKDKHKMGRKLEALMAGLMLLSFFLPWLYSLGAPVAAYQIRERLAGPHHLLSSFTSGSRISNDYSLSICLYVIPLGAMIILGLLFIRRYQAWVGFLAGVATLVAFLFLRGEVTNFPFHRLAAGAYLALTSGIGLTILPIYRLIGKTTSSG